MKKKLINSHNLAHRVGLTKLLKIMKITVILLVLFMANLNAGVYSQSVNTSIKLKDVSLKEALDTLELKSDFKFLYRADLIDINKKINIDVDQETSLDFLMSVLLKDTKINYNVINEDLIVLSPEGPLQQTGITGRVSDSKGEPLAGAFVRILNTQSGTITDANGNYAINAAPGETLVFTFVGYEDQQQVVGTSKVIDVIMIESAEMLDEIVVLGYATGIQRSISGAVERVTAEDMNTGYVATPLDAMQGKVAGMSMTKDGGNVLEVPTIRLRGLNSLSGGNDPLIIIDGVFTSVEAFSNMSAQDVEEITVLKDASETAQYGSRGAAGVIVVTTKKGKTGQAVISYDGQFGISQAYKNLQILNADEFRDLNTTKFAGTGPDLGYNTNWVDWVQNDLVTQNNHNLSFTQGNESTAIRVSVGVSDRKGTLRNSGNTFYTARINASQRGLGERLQLDLNLNGTYIDQTAEDQGVWAGATSYNPTYPTQRNPATGIWDVNPNTNMVTHPGELMDYENFTESGRITSSLRAAYNIVKGLTLSGFGAFDLGGNINKAYRPNNLYGTTSMRGQADIGNSYSKDWQANLQLNYANVIGKHSLNALALMEGQSYYSYFDRTYAQGFESNYFKYNLIQAGATSTWNYTKSGANKNTILSYMGRLNYMFDNKYIITVNARADGSSKLGENSKWGFFPSVSVAWALIEESFMKNQNLFSNVKLRVSYGVTGNQNAISPLNSKMMWEPSKTTDYMGKTMVTFTLKSNDNPDLKWETKYTTDLGVDLSMFRGRIRSTIDYYHSKIKDLLWTYDVPVPPFKYDKLLANMGEMTNDGLEFSLTGEVLKSGDWGMTVTGNFAWQKNKLISLHGTYKGESLTTAEWVPLGSAGGAGHTSNTNVTYMAEGQPVGIFRLPVHDGFITDAEGRNRYTFKDINGGGIDQSDGGDREILGQVTPKVISSLNLQLRYKRFDITTNLRGAFGHKIYNYTALTLNNLNNFPTYNVLKTAPGLAIYDIAHTSYWLEKGDYVNIEYITLGYNIPSKFIKLISSARIALSINNVATITGYSGLTPMINSTNFADTNTGTFGQETGAIFTNRGGIDARNIYPIMRTYTFQLMVNF